MHRAQSLIGRDKGSAEAVGKVSSSFPAGKEILIEESRRSW